MKTYYYAHTGHRIGLDRFRRAVAILSQLDEDITLLTSDYRIAQIAKDFAIEKSVGLDVVRNIPQIADNGDRLIFDSDEANPIMLEDMKQYFSTFVQIQNDTVVVHEHFTKQSKMKKDVAISFFFGDDDYEKDLEKNIELVESLQAHLQLGFYYFLDYEEMLKKKFPNYFEFEEYEDMIHRSKILVTCSPQAALDSLASGSKPIYIKREDYAQDFDDLFYDLNIPIVENYDLNHINVIIKTINDINYVNITHKSDKFMKMLREKLNLN